MISWGVCMIFLLISHLTCWVQAAYISVLAVAEAIADHEQGRCGKTDPYTDVSLSMLRGENLLSHLFLYQQIKLTSKTLGMCRERYLMVLCKSSIPAHDLWFLLSWAGGHWECRELFFTPLYFLSINRVQLLLPVCHWLARRVFWQLCPWSKRDLLPWAHLAVGSVVLFYGSISHSIHV